MQRKWLLSGGASLYLFVASFGHAGGGHEDSRLNEKLSAQLLACGLVDTSQFGLSARPFTDRGTVSSGWKNAEVNIELRHIARTRSYQNAYCEQALLESLYVLSYGNTTYLEERCDFLFDKSLNRTQSVFMREFGEGRDGGNPFLRAQSSRFNQNSGEQKYCTSSRTRRYYSLACDFQRYGREMGQGNLQAYISAKDYVSENCGSVKPNIYARKKTSFDRARSHNARQLLLRHRPYDVYGNAHCHGAYGNAPVIITKKENTWTNLLNFGLGMTRVIAPLHYQTKVARMKHDLLHHGMHMAARQGATPWLVGGGNLYGGGYGGRGACGVPPYNTNYTGCAYGPGGGGAHYPYGQYPFRGGHAGNSYGPGGFYPGVPGAGGQFGWRSPGIFPGAGGPFGGGYGSCGGRPCLPGYAGAVTGGRYPGGIPGAGGRFAPGGYYPGYGGGMYPGVPGAGGRFGPNAYPFSGHGMANINQLNHEMHRLRQEQILAQRRAQQIAQAQQRAQQFQNQARTYHQQLQQLGQQRLRLDAQARQNMMGLNSAYRGYQGVLSSIRGPAGNAGAYGIPGAAGRFGPGGYQGGGLTHGGQRLCVVNCYPGTQGAYYNPPYVSPIGGYGRGAHGGVGIHLNYSGRI